MIKLKNQLYTQYTTLHVTGFHTIKSILTYTPKRAIILQIHKNNKRNKILQTLACRQNIKINTYFNKNDNMHNNETILICKHFQYTSLNDILKTNINLIIILDRIQDHNNIGKIARLMLALGADLMIIGSSHSASITPIIEKIAVGSLSQIPVTKSYNLIKTIKQIKQNNFHIIGADINSSQSCYEYKFKKQTAIIIGNEGYGLKINIKKQCNALIRIPMQYNMTLNASDATAIFIYEFIKQHTLNYKL